MPNERFEFSVESLSYSSIEDIIVNHYDLGDANSSNFTELPEGNSSAHYIMATKGIIEFSSLVFKKIEGLYYVICYHSNVKKER